jgi:hypothetical protein
MALNRTHTIDIQFVFTHRHRWGERHDVDSGGTDRPSPTKTSRLQCLHSPASLAAAEMDAGAIWASSNRPNVIH